MGQQNNSKELRLPLKKKWFEMSGPDGKIEDYRELTDYWANKLLLHNGKKESRGFWYMLPIKFEHNTLEFHKSITIIPFAKNIMTLGYPKSTDTSRIKVFEHAGIEIRTGKKEWGAEPGKLYFVIKHGKQL